TIVKTAPRPNHLPMSTTKLILLLCSVLSLASCKRAFKAPLYDGKLVDADYWSEEPKILSAGLGFVGILGIPDKVTRETALAAGAAWYEGLDCSSGEEPSIAMQTGAALKSGIQMMAQGKQAVDYGDGLPIVF